MTIDDCTHVIDAGRVREMRYDPITRMSCLVEVWISKVRPAKRTTVRMETAVGAHMFFPLMIISVSKIKLC